MFQTNFGGDQIADIARMQAQQKQAEQKKAQEAAFVAEGRNSDGSYKRPEWESLIDPATGLLKDNYQIGNNYQQVDLDMAGINKFKSEAMRDAGTDSPWAKLMLDQQKLQQQQQMSKTAATQNAGMTAAFDQLAATGGLTGGSRERLAKSSLRDMMTGRQDIRMAGAQNELGIRTQDETSRQQMLSQVPGMDLNVANYNRGNEEAKIRLQETNVRNALNEQNLKRGDAMDAWKKNQEVWASGKQSEAQSKASGGGK